MNSTPKLPAIEQGANKYTRGSLLVLAGSRRYFGAGVLAVLAAEKAGAGYISLATPASAALAARQHLLCSPVIEAREAENTGSFDAAALPEILAVLRTVDAICCGPGLTVQEGTIAFVGAVLHYAAENNIPLILDADALNALAVQPTLLSKRRIQEGVSTSCAGAYQNNPLILTPHTGELARLRESNLRGNKDAHEGSQKTSQMDSPGDSHSSSSLTTPASQAAEALTQESASRTAEDTTQESVSRTAETLAQELGAIVVAKGPTTFIAGDGELTESSEATPALAKAGTGDVLAGIIGSFLAQGMSAKDAALLGVRVHSKAGILAEQKQGRRSVTALDVIEAIPQALKAFESH